MIVKIKTYGVYSHILNGLGSIVLKDSKLNVKMFLDRISYMYPELNDKIFDEDGRLIDYAIILKNGKNIDSLNGLSTEIEEDDEITLLPLISGG